MLISTDLKKTVSVALPRSACLTGSNEYLVYDRDEDIETAVLIFFFCKEKKYNMISFRCTSCHL